MDGVSPGAMPSQFAIGGTAWSGDQPWAGGTMLDPTVCGGGIPYAGASMLGDQALPNHAPCGCYVGAWWGIVPPPRCAAHGGLTTAPVTTTTTNTLKYTTPALSEADVERIARRMIELLREGNRER